MWGAKRLPNGWVIPEKLGVRAGSKRVRTARNRGYVVLMTHSDEDGKGANKFTYNIESKVFTLTLGAAFFGENLRFIEGAAPPPKPEGDGEDGEWAYDIVDGKYVNRLDAPVWTAHRAREHYGEC